MTTLTEELEERYGKANSGARMWSTAHHGTGILSILCSCFVAVIASGGAGLSVEKAPAVAALSGVAAALTAISTFGGFSRKWRINRTTRTALRCLRLDLASHGETPELREKFKQILFAHDRGILGNELSGDA